MHFAAFALLCFIWSSSWLAIRFSLEGFPPFLGCAFRFVLAAALLGAVAGWKGLSFRLARRHRLVVVLNSVLTYVLNYGLIYWAEQYLNAGVTAVIFAIFPLFTALFSIFAFRLEPFRAGVLIGLSLAMAGIVVIFSNDLRSARLEGPALWGGAAVLVSAVSAAATVGLVKKHLGDMNSIILSFYGTVLGAAGLLAVGLVRGERLAVDPSPSAIAAVIYLGVAASAVAFTVYYWLLKAFRPTTMSIIIYVTPVLTLLMDWAVFGLAPSISVLGGVALILTGVLIAELPRYQQAQASEGELRAKSQRRKENR